jgi:hypothetical protein
MPVYEQKSFEELRLEDYMAGNKGSMSEPNNIRATDFKDWGGSDLNTLLEVDLGTERIVLKRPLDGGMYTKQQCLHLIKATTVKVSKERGQLIRFLGENHLVPNNTALYKLLEQDEKGLSIGDDNWGMEIHTQQQPHPLDMIHWKSRTIPEPLPSSYYKKERESIGENIMSRGKMTRLKIMYERGWEGHVRMLLKPIRFCDLGHVSNSLKSIRAQLIDICSYLGYQGDEGPASQQRVCRIYFDPQLYPAPHDLNEGGNTATFNELKSYIRSAASNDESPVTCSSTNKKYHCKEFRCNKHFCNSEGKWKTCPFYFQVRWDYHGYYIHLRHHPHWYRNCGSSWHCCRANKF